MIHDADEFKRYSQSDDDEEFSRIYDSAEDVIWLDILEKYPDLSFYVVQNHTISERILDQLSLSEDRGVRWEVATKRRISRIIFERLSRDADAGVRQRIACNPKVPDDILIFLSVDLDELVSEFAKERLGL
ncbi:hypothetical protein [Burkholderia pyrrocinia]|uniref:hypothetical protein n=1 Tax=Burkholderia pyrrocinia TaxID=60550 RepID=UPI00158E0589|nr:hypothetical protein [Burkholderia pyrrocinia]